MAARNKSLAGRIHASSAKTPDPARAERNLQGLFDAVRDGETRSRLLSHLEEIAVLFAASQFLAGYSTAHPPELASALEDIDVPLTKEFFAARAESELAAGADRKEAMRALRLFKRRRLLSITLRDLTGKTGMAGSMEELSGLAGTLIGSALEYSLKINRKRFGVLRDEAISLIALGKLGGEELNYSSDVDLLAVYGDASGEGTTSGVPGPSGVVTNRITAHEFYGKVIELFSRLLSAGTEEGIALRVDLRLRPQGARGEIALPLASYKAYYESWGRTWERMALTRARPVAGDDALGRAFIKTIEPFVWRQTSDYSEIEEIRALKKKIDSIFSRDDIKRGYGGLREAEFFVQTFQILYGAREAGLRTNKILGAMNALRAMGIIPEKDLDSLRENYLYLRRIEHFLQMKDDLQTHSVPGDVEELPALARLAGFKSAKEFSSDLKMKRLAIKTMYNTLLGTEEDAYAETLSLLEGDFSDDELSGYLAFRGVEDREQGLLNLKGIREKAGSFASPADREIIRHTVPALLEKALKSDSPGRALSGLESFIGTFGSEEVFLKGLQEHGELSNGIIKLWALSETLTRALLSSPLYLGLLIEENPIRKTLRKTEAALANYIRPSKGAQETLSRLAEYKRAEEIRLGIYFLQNIIGTASLLRYLSHVADAVIKAAAARTGAASQGFFSVIAMGKLGGREITYGSDLDLIFLAEKPPGMDAAAEIVKGLASYTPSGILYELDMRLRPDGSKGVLVKDIEGYRNYYRLHAGNWEIQALLKARPVAGDAGLSGAFLQSAREILIERGPGIPKEEIAGMRRRIITWKKNTSPAPDIKLGAGGIEEIEFYVQWLQLANARRAPGVLVQNTAAALRRLSRHGIIGKKKAGALLAAYEYLRRLQSFERLNEGSRLFADAGFTGLAALFMGEKDAGGLHARLKETMDGVLRITR